MPTLRERQTDVTREAIFDALVEIIAQEGVAGFSVQAVADAAGVSHRTVYRHFPTREALLDGLAARFNAQFGERLAREDPADFTADEIPEIAEVGYQIFNDDPQRVAAYVKLIVGAHLEPPSRAGRTELFANALQQHLAHLSPADGRAVTALIRTLASTVTWHHVLAFANGPKACAPRVVRWAIRCLLDDLASGGGPTT